LYKNKDHYSFRMDYSRRGYRRRPRDEVGSLFGRGYDDFSRGGRNDRRVYSRIRYDFGYPRLCEVCHLSLANAQQFEAHCSGKKHLKNLKKLSGEDNWNNGIPVQAVLTEEMMDADQEYIETNPETDIRMCTLCYVDFTSDIMEESHRTGKRHLKNVKYAKQGLLNGQTDASLGKCEICNVLFTSPIMRLTHLNGRRHEEECRYRGIPLEQTKKRPNAETKETRSPKRVKTEADNGRDSIRNVKEEKPVKKEPTRKVMSSQKISPTDKAANQKNADVRKTEEVKNQSISTANTLTKSRINSSNNKDSYECNAKALAESPKEDSVNSKPVVKLTSTKAKETPETLSHQANKTGKKVKVTGEAAPVIEENPAEQTPLLPHQLIEQEADAAYEKYAQTAEDNPERAHQLYGEYREIYKRYEVAYQEYLDSLNLDDIS